MPPLLVEVLWKGLLVDRVDYRLAILGGLAAWLVAALAIFLAPKLF